MKVFEVNISEMSSKIVKVEASDAEEAYNKTRDMYYSEEIVLDYSDFDDVDFEVLENLND